MSSRDDFARFVEDLHRELTCGADWENDQLGRFLAALAGWVRSSGAEGNAGRSVPEQPTWALFATALDAATIDELVIRP